MGDFGSHSEYKAAKADRELNFYEILDVPFDASRLQIREAYIRLKSTFSSSGQALYSLISDEDARKALESLDEAYRTLNDEVLRRNYDLKVFRQENKRSSDNSNFGNEFRSQQWPRFQSRSQGTRVSGTVSYERQSGVDDIWAGHSKRPELRGGGQLHIVGESAKAKRFSPNAFDESTQTRVQNYIEQASSIDGAFFIGLRELLSVTQEEIQDKTKISLQYIKAIENDDFRCLPSLVYVKGFLKCYLQYLGLEQESARIIDAYTENYINWRIKKGMEPN